MGKLKDHTNEATKPESQPPDRPWPHSNDDYEQMWLLAHAPTKRPKRVRAVDESYVFTRLVQGRVPVELVDGLRVRCPEAFTYASALSLPLPKSQREEYIEHFITAWHAKNGLPPVDFKAIKSRLKGIAA